MFLVRNRVFKNRNYISGSDSSVFDITNGMGMVVQGNRNNYGSGRFVISFNDVFKNGYVGIGVTTTDRVRLEGNRIYSAFENVGPAPKFGDF